MEYYGIIDKIKEKHKSGIYGRRPLKKNEKLSTDFTSVAKTIGISFLLQIVFKWNLIIYVGYEIYKYVLGKKEIKLQHPNEGNPKKNIIIPNELLNNDYEVKKSASVLYGLFDEFKNKEKVFKALLKSKGGSSLIIVERDTIPLEHYGGQDGLFNYGVYVPHPKTDKILIPLNNSNELIKSLILEETIRAFQTLGAKKITIEDKTNINANLKGGDEKIKGGVNGKYKKEIIREKEFGTGTFDTEEALKDKLFIYDYPNIMTTIKARIDGNQLIEKFTETINLSAGLDMDVLGLFGGNVNFNYNRTWYFEVVFYDKNDK